MKTALVAVIGMVFFMLAFLTGGVLQWSGHKHYSRIFIYVAVIIFGLSMLVGIYSSVKKYGYMWANVRREDSAASFAQLDKKYERMGKDTWQYWAGVVFFCVAGLVACILGAVLLTKELIKG